MGWVPVPKARPGSRRRLTASGFAPAGADPQASAALDGLVVAHPLPLPVLVLEQVDVVRGQGGGALRRQSVEYGPHVGGGVEQAGHPGAVPHRALVQPRLVQGLVGTVFQGDGGGAERQQGVLQGLGAVAIGIQFQLQPGQGDSPSRASREASSRGSECLRRPCGTRRREPAPCAARYWCECRRSPALPGHAACGSAQFPGSRHR